MLVALLLPKNPNLFDYKLRLTYHHYYRTHIQHYGRLAIKRARNLVPLIPSKLLQLAKTPLADPNSIEAIFGTEIYTGFMASLL